MEFFSWLGFLSPPLIIPSRVSILCVSTFRARASSLTSAGDGILLCCSCAVVGIGVDSSISGPLLVVRVRLSFLWGGLVRWLPCGGEAGQGARATPDGRGTPCPPGPSELGALKLDAANSVPCSSISMPWSRRLPVPADPPQTPSVPCQFPITFDLKVPMDLSRWSGSPCHLGVAPRGGSF